MSKVMQVYGLTVNEALKLSNGQVDLMIEQAEAAMGELLRGDVLRSVLQEKIAPVRRAVRTELGGGWEFEESVASPADDTAQDDFGFGAETSSAETVPAEGEPGESASAATTKKKPIGKPPKL